MSRMVAQWFGLSSAIVNLDTPIRQLVDRLEDAGRHLTLITLQAGNVLGAVLSRTVLASTRDLVIGLPTAEAVLEAAEA